MGATFNPNNYHYGGAANGGGGSPVPPPAASAPPVNFNNPGSLNGYLQNQKSAFRDPASGENGTNPYLPQAVATAHAKDPTDLGTEIGYQDIWQRQTAGSNYSADPSKYQLNGDPNYAANEAARLQKASAATAGRQAPTIDQSKMDPYTSAASGAAGALGSTALMSMGMAGGQSVQGQMGAAGQQLGAGQQQLGAGDALMKLGQMPAGPSAAELAMRQQSDSNIAAQSAMAAGARGGNVGLAGMNAAANAGQIGGQETAQIGVQRAQEDMANRTFAANTINQAGQTYGAAGNTIGGAGQTFQGAGATQQAGITGAATAQNNQGQLDTTLSGQQSDIARSNADNALRQTGLNDQLGWNQDQESRDIIAAQTANNIGYDQARTGNFLQVRGQNVGQATAEHATDVGQTNAIIGGGLSTVGAIGGAMVGGPAGAAGGAAAGGAAAKAATSDIRAKTRIAPGGEHIDNTFRALGGYGYDYADPSAPGSAPGRHFGPMAQELEQTPAGASAVVRQSNGTKGIDTGRLALVNASETARLRQELDALKGGQPLADRIRSMRVRYPGDPDVQLPEQRVAASVPPTPLFYGEDNGGTFRTPDEQLAYSRSLGARTAATPAARMPTPLEFDPADGGTFRDPAEQYAYARSRGAELHPDTARAVAAIPKREAKIETLATTDAAKEDALAKMKAQLASATAPTMQALAKPTPYPAAQQPMAYGY